MKRPIQISRRGFVVATIAGAPLSRLFWDASPSRVPIVVSDPGVAWERHSSPEAAGFNGNALAEVESRLYPKATTSLMVVQTGKIAYSYGDISHVSYLASARKSVLSMLYGKYVANGRIRLDRTIGELGINETGDGLLPIEKSATIRDLLTSSSGVYWPAGSPGGDSATTPPRGSAKPGTRFHYNNWDFNVAGAVFAQLTGRTVFQSLEQDLAQPLEFQDFDPARQRMLSYQGEPSRYQAYHMFLSARDMARLGVVMLNGGVWHGKQIVPRTWVSESTALRVSAVSMDRKSSSGYGYLWWIPSESRRDAAWRNAFLASGNYGQFILGLPAAGLVIVHRRAVTDEFAIARNLGKSVDSPAGGAVSADEFLALADLILAARQSKR